MTQLFEKCLSYISCLGEFGNFNLKRLMIQCFKHVIRLEKEIQVIQVILGHLQYTDIHENQHYNNVADVVEIHTIGKRNGKRNNKIFRKNLLIRQEGSTEACVRSDKGGGGLYLSMVVRSRLITIY